MTIEKYLQSVIESSDRTAEAAKVYSSKTTAYYRGRRDAFAEILRNLSEFDRDTTLKEFTAYCRKFSRNCDECGLWNRGECPYQNNLPPDEWHTEEIEKAIKEKKHE